MVLQLKVVAQFFCLIVFVMFKYISELRIPDFVSRPSPLANGRCSVYRPFFLQISRTLTSLLFIAPNVLLYFENSNSRVTHLTAPNQSLCLPSFALAAGLSPTGKLPLLEVDGKVLTASKAILSYVAREIGE